MHHRIPAPAAAPGRLCVALAVRVRPCRRTGTTAHGRGPQRRSRTLDTLVVTAVAPGAPLTWTTDPLPRQPVPASDGADYLKTIPGFAAIRNGGNGDPVLRGMFGSRLNVVDNGGTLAGACPSRMDNPLSYISPQTSRSAGDRQGPQSVRWGPGLRPAPCASSATRRFDAPALELDASALAGSRNRNDQA
jgi:iron complex outermembrane receptor protein